MSLLITTVLLLPLLWSEIRTPGESENALVLTAQVTSISTLVPVFAAFQNVDWKKKASQGTSNTVEYTIPIDRHRAHVGVRFAMREFRHVIDGCSACRAVGKFDSAPR